jgi:hypothetical protein
MTVVFDDRAVPAWAPPLDDPWAWQAPLNGTYYFNFTGQGNVSTVPGQNDDVTVTNTTFDAATFTTAGYITLPPASPNLIVIQITNTQRNASAPVGSGFTNLRIMRPGHYDDTTNSAFTLSPEMKQLVTNSTFNHIRFMGATGTNSQAGYYGDEGHHYLDFTDRCLPTDALNPMGALRAGCWGIPWETVIQVSQQTNTGVWINAPISATVSVSPSMNTSSYVYQWATLMKNGNEFTNNTGIPDTLPIYLEHSNEGKLDDTCAGLCKGEKNRAS